MSHINYFHCFQGDWQVLDVLDHTLKNTGPKVGSKPRVPTKSYRAYKDITDQAEINEKVQRPPESSPNLYFFFSDAKRFDFAIVSADEHQVKITSGVAEAILAYIGFHYVFHIGNVPVYQNFHAFLQTVFLNDKYTTKVPDAWTNLLNKYDTAYIAGIDISP